MSKNLCAKVRPQDNPYEIWVDGDWEWRVLKKYKSPEGEAKDKYARWFCAVKSPYTHGGYELGDVYVNDIKQNATKMESTFITKEEAEEFTKWAKETGRAD